MIVLNPLVSVLETEIAIHSETEMVHRFPYSRALFPCPFWFDLNKLICCSV